MTVFLDRLSAAVARAGRPGPWSRWRGRYAIAARLGRASLDGQ